MVLWCQATEPLLVSYGMVVVFPSDKIVKTVDCYAVLFFIVMLLYDGRSGLRLNDGPDLKLFLFD